MFKARVLTGAVLICGVFCLAYLASNLLGLLVFTGMLFLSALEWGALAGLQSFRERLAFSSLLCGMGVFSVFVPVSLFGLSTQYLLGLSSLIIWSVIGVWIVCYQKHGFPIVRNSFGLCSLGFLVLVPFFLSIVFIWNTQPIKFLALVLIVSSVDIFAYF
jgi:CDP-diglyceride synthetase